MICIHIILCFVNVALEVENGLVRMSGSKLKRVILGTG